MQTYLDCIPCFMEQALSTARLATDKEEKIKEILDLTGEMIQDVDMEKSPPAFARKLYKNIKTKTDTTDPFAQQKQEHIKRAQKIYPHMKELLDESENRLLTAVKLAIAGNVIDLGMDNTFSIEEDILQSLHNDLVINEFSEFTEKIETGDDILYIGDNTGEAVFDKILLEELNNNITFIVREKPIINDITTKEALQIGIDEVADIQSSGTSAPGTVLETCTDEFLNRLYQADLIISKGQGNYETLSEIEGAVFFLLKAKCPVIARDIGVEQGAHLLMKNE